MILVDLDVRLDDPSDWIESQWRLRGLDFQRVVLATKPGCIHWHARFGGRTGTLEATWCPESNRLWLSVHSNRNGDWIGAEIGHLQREAARRSDG